MLAGSRQRLLHIRCFKKLVCLTQHKLHCALLALKLRKVRQALVAATSAVVCVATCRLDHVGGRFYLADLERSYVVRDLEHLVLNGRCE